MNITYVLLAAFLWTKSYGNPEFTAQEQDPWNDIRAYLVEKNLADAESSLKLLQRTNESPEVFIVQVDGKTSDQKLRRVVTMVRVAKRFRIRESTRLSGGTTYPDIIQAKASILNRLNEEYSKHLKLYPSTLKKTITADEVLLTDVHKIDEQNFEVVCETDHRALSGTVSIAKLIRNRDGSFYVTDLLTSKR